ncbi:hypothetical protein IQ07DRAFT_541375 [Pyrenochaeta sp. DS3sAY3a]|nr:hypothetical protein IQ07DRAFT_541375 [Pyrenochaeta sp. DS3sAY3a]
MSWTLLVSSLQGGSPTEVPLPKEGTAYVVVSPIASVRQLWVTSELQPVLHLQLGQISVDRHGAKLKAIKGTLSVLPAQANSAPSTDAAFDPRTEAYELQPQTDLHSEVIFLRHGDVIGSAMAPNVFTCRFNKPEIQVNSSAAEAEAVERSESDSVIGTLEDETEDENDLDLDDTAIAVSATQAMFQPNASPLLSNEQRTVVQETPTVNRIDRDTKFFAPFEKNNEDQRNGNTDGIPRQGGEQTDSELFSTARTAKSQPRELESTVVESVPVVQPASMASSASGTIAPPTATSYTEDGSLDVQKQPSEPPPEKELLRLPRKRPSPLPEEDYAEVKSSSRSNKRSKPTARDQIDSPTSRKSASVKIVIHNPQPSAAKRKRRTSIDSTAQDTTPSRSQSNTSSAQKYKGEAPRVAFSHSAIALNSQAVKFLKKHGGAVANSVDDNCDVLCVKDGSLTKTMKLLESIARGIPIVTDKWLLDSATQDNFLPFEDYRPSAPDQEASWKFSLDKVWGKPQKPFEGYTLQFTFELQKSYTNFDEIKQVCRAVGATISAKKSASKRIVLAKDSGDKDFAKFTQDGTKCFSKDFLTNGILRGEFDLESEEFLIQMDGPSATADTPKANRKKSRKS